MQPIKISTAQFENKSGDKSYNLSIIDTLAGQAAAEGSHVITFHECSITGYSFARKLSREELLALSEQIPNGESVQDLIRIAKKHDIVILAGLFEKDETDQIYKGYVCVDGNGLIAKYRKLHPFINPHIKPGNEYCVFDLFGWKCGILICYDNNIIENVRATKLLGADIIFMPHVTMCTPSTRPGAGFVDPKLWENRD
jgi:predicted amidohydrolase